MTDEQFDKTRMFDQKRRRLERYLVDAALELNDFMGVSALRVQIPDTNPPVYVYVGTEEKVKGLLDVDLKEE